MMIGEIPSYSDLQKLYPYLYEQLKAEHRYLHDEVVRELASIRTPCEAGTLFAFAQVCTDLNARATLEEDIVIEGQYGSIRCVRVTRASVLKTREFAAKQLAEQAEVEADDEDIPEEHRTDDDEAELPNDSTGVPEESL